MVEIWGPNHQSTGVVSLIGGGDPLQEPALQGEDDCLLVISIFIRSLESQGRTQQAAKNPRPDDPIVYS